MKKYFILFFALFLMASLSAQEEVVQEKAIKEFGGEYFLPFWSAPKNWDPIGVPLANDTVFIQTDAAFCVVSGQVYCARILVGDDALSPGAGVLYLIADLNCSGDILVENGGLIDLRGTGGTTLTANSIQISEGGRLVASQNTFIFADIICYGTIDIWNDYDTGIADLTIDGDLALHPGTSNQAVLRVGAEDNLTVVNGITYCDTYIKNGRWVFYNSPFASGSTAEQLYLDGDPNVYLTTWPAGADTNWTNFEYITSLSTDLGDYDGYAVWLNGNDSLSFEQSGELRVEDATSYSFPLYDYSDDKFDGWNLLGNPFMADLDVTQFQFGSGVVNNIWILWYGESTDYKYIEVDPNPIGEVAPQYISPMQSFFVQYSPKIQGSTGTLGMDGDMTSLSREATYLKSKERTVPANLMTVCLQDGSEYEERLRFWLNPEATLEPDPLYDVTKLLGTNAFNYIYHEDAEENLYYRYGVPGPVEGEELAVSINLIINNPGEMTFSFYDIAQYDPDYSIILTDNLTNGYYNLREISALTFESEAGTFDDRFVLHFTKGTTGVGEAGIVTTEIFCVDHVVRVNFASEPESAASVSVIDMSGRTCYNATLSQKNNQFSLDLPAGIYVVKTVNGSVLSSEKIVLN